MKIRIFQIILVLFICGCAGTINTVDYQKHETLQFKKAYIISSKNSQFIKFKFGTIIPYGCIPPVDAAAVKKEIIGNTDTIIKQELERHGIQSMIGKKGDYPKDFDLIVEYSDTWRWDFKKILDKLEINFISPNGDSLLAKLTYNIYKNKEMHNFPTPKKEVPKMIKELLNKKPVK